jgi:SAM-dependent methyltransferase
MKTSRPFAHTLRAALVPAILAAGVAFAQEKPAQDKPFEPVSGQAGKDVVWVPTPASTVEKMLDVARITPQDYVMDLGSGDGRNIIAAAKRGARALGVEFNPQMVELSTREAVKAGVGDKAKFVQGDMFAADISQATALALFLLPDNLRKLDAKFQALRPGTRIVVNTFGIDGWTPEVTEQASDCGAWCSVMLYIVPAKVGGTWKTGQGELKLEQKVQTVTGSFNGAPIEEGRVRGELVTFKSGGTVHVARVKGNTLEGKGWTATRM